LEDDRAARTWDRSTHSRIALAVVATFVVFSAIMFGVNRHDRAAKWSLVLGVLMLIRVVVVNRGNFFSLGYGAAADAFPWWRVELCDLWGCGIAAMYYGEAVAERPAVGRRLLTLVLGMCAVVPWFFSSEQNWTLLPIGQLCLVGAVGTVFHSLSVANPSRAVRVAQIGLGVALFGSIGAVFAGKVIGSTSLYFEALPGIEPFFQMAVLALRANDARRKSVDLARATAYFVPREFLHALGHDDVTTTKLGDATAKSITVLFADIRNFTSSSEGMTPEETFAFLNGCLSKLGPHVRAQSGFVDKYIGDAIMALFPRDPSDAVRAAIAMQDELRRSNDALAGRAPLDIGVGIHVGNVMMGTIGEAERFEATVISDAVNLTARLESLTKQLGCSVLISEEVFSTLDEDLRKYARRLGTFIVKGKAQPVALYEVFASDSDALRETKVLTRERFNAMLSAFAGDRIDEALAIASELRDACPDDGPANWWVMRLVKASAATGDDAVPSSRGIVRLDEK
jgi:class 3 adenylate cyclase